MSFLINVILALKLIFPMFTKERKSEVALDISHVKMSYRKLLNSSLHILTLEEVRSGCWFYLEAIFKPFL